MEGKTRISEILNRIELNLQRVEDGSELKDVLQDLKYSFLELSEYVDYLRFNISDLIQSAKHSAPLPNVKLKSLRKSVCSYLLDYAISLGKPHKIFFTSEFVNYLQKTGYKSRSFQRDPNRTVYNCIVRDSQKRFYRPASLFKSGFVLNREIAAQIQNQKIFRSKDVFNKTSKRGS